MGTGKGVIDVDIAQIRQALGKIRRIGFLARTEADIFQQQDIAIRHMGNRTRRCRQVREGDRPAQGGAQPSGQRRQ